MIETSGTRACQENGSVWVWLANAYLVSSNITISGGLQARLGSVLIRKTRAVTAMCVTHFRSKHSFGQPFY